jgi:hypothetical protein
MNEAASQCVWLISAPVSSATMAPFSSWPWSFHYPGIKHGRVAQLPDSQPGANVGAATPHGEVSVRGQWEATVKVGEGGHRLPLCRWRLRHASPSQMGTL